MAPSHPLLHWVCVSCLLVPMAIAIPDALALSAASVSPAIQNALDLANRAGSARDRVRVWVAAAERAIAMGNATDALQLLQEARRVVQEMESEAAQVTELLAIAQLYDAIEAAEQGLETLDQAAATAPSIADRWQRIEAWRAIAAAYANALQPAQAAIALEEALIAAQTAEPSDQQAIALSLLAIQAADLGQNDLSEELIAQSQTVLLALESNEESEPILEPQPWNGSIGLSSSIFSGERTRGIVTLAADGERQWRHTILDLGLRLTYDFDRARDDADLFSGQVTADNLFYLSEDLQYFTNASAASNNLENLNLRARLATGLSFNVWERGSDRRLDLRAGVGIRYENFEGGDENFNPISATLGLNYRDLWFSIFRFEQNLTFDLPLDDASDYLFQSQTTVGIPISDRWSLNNSARLTLSGEPAEDNPGLLFNLQTGVRYDF